MSAADMTRRDAVAALAFGALMAPRLPLPSRYRDSDTIAWLRERIPGDFARQVAEDLVRHDATLTPQANKAFARKFAPESEAGLVRTQRAMQQDYEQGNIVLVGGWMVSLTEARLVAAAA